MSKGKISTRGKTKSYKDSGTREKNKKRKIERHLKKQPKDAQSLKALGKL